MKYEKKNLDNYNFHIIKTKKFKTITIKINFKRLLTREDITKRNLLSDILVKSSKKYNTERLLAIATEDLYGISFNAFSLTSGRYGILGFNFHFLSEDYTEKGIIKDVIEFIKEIIFNPNIENNSFEKESFLIAKKRILDEIESVSENPNQYATNRLYDLMDQNSLLSYHPEGTKEDLEKITSESLCSFYQDILKNDIVDVFVLGDIDDEIEKQIIDIFKFDDRNNKNESHYVDDVKRRDKVESITEKSHFTQSKMFLTYNLDEITPFERDYVSYVYSSILGGGGDSKLFKNIREKQSLCYTIGSSINRIFGIMNIRLGFDYKNYDRVIQSIKECLKDMEDGKFDEKEIEKTKTFYKNSLEEIFDSPFRILNHYVSKEYLHIEDIDTRIKNIEKVDKKMIMDFAKKIKGNMIYCLEGKDNDEEETK